MKHLFFIVAFCASLLCQAQDEKTPVPDSVILGVEEAIELQAVRIYPNPSPGQVTIEGNFDSYRVINAQGVEVSKDLARAPRGLYYVILRKKTEILPRRLLLY